MKLLLFSILLLSISCENPGTNNNNNNVDAVSKNDPPTKAFPSKVVIILSKKLNTNSDLINIQDYVENGRNFIPVFTSKEKFNESTKGVDTFKQVIEIDGIFLLSLLNGTETLRLNPSLADEKYYQASELILRYRTEIDNLKLK